MIRPMRQWKTVPFLATIAVLVCLAGIRDSTGKVFSQEQSRKNILVLYSLESTQPVYGRFLAGLDDALMDHSGPVDLFHEFMDVGRINDKSYLHSLKNHYKTKYASKNLALIITVGLAALDYIHREGSSVFPDVPFLSAAITAEHLTERNLNGKIPSVTGLLDVRGCIELILSLQPALENLYIVAGSNPLEQPGMGLLRRIQREYEGKLRFIYLANLSYDELMASVTKVPPGSAILFKTFLTDSRGESFTTRQMSIQLSETANCPVYGLFELIGYGIVGGSMVSYYQQGRAAGSLAYRLLFEENTGDPAPVIRVAPLQIVDEQQMVRWGIPERNVPEGYQIVNRVPSLWRDYRYHMIAAILFFLAQSTLIVSLLVQKKNRKSAEQKLLLAEREAQQRELQLLHADKMISLGTMASGIAHEINNPNNFISVNAPLLKKTWEGVVEVLDETAEGNGDLKIGRIPYSRAREQIPALLGGIMEGSERIRAIVRDMKEFINQSSPGMEEQVDLNSVVRSSLNLLSNKLNKSTRNLHVEYGKNIPLLKGNAQRLEQVVVNLLLNAAESLPDSEKAITVKTSYDGDRQLIDLTVTDEGCGIDPETLRRIFDPFFTTKREAGGTGLGLAISLSIVKAHGGRIQISSGEREGTTAVVELPATDASSNK